MSGQWTEDRQLNINNLIVTVTIQRSYASNRQVNKAKLTPTDRNNATDEKLLSVALFLSVGKTCSVCKDFLVSKSQIALLFLQRFDL
jgi:hypothetical protein